MRVGVEEREICDSTMRRGVSIALPMYYLLLVLQNHMPNAENIREFADTDAVQ